MEQHHINNVFSLNNSNPLEIPEILAAVLRYIEPCKNDLLNCRLVNHSWNQATVQLVKKKGWRIALDESNLFKYRALLRKVKLSRQSTTTIPNSAASKPRIVYTKPYLHLPAEPSCSTKTKFDHSMHSLDLSLNLNKNVQVQDNNLIFATLNLLIQNPQLRVISFAYTSEDKVNDARIKGKEEEDEEDDDDDTEDGDNTINDSEVDLSKILTLVLPNLANFEIDMKFLNRPPIRAALESFLQTGGQLQALESLFLYLNVISNDFSDGSEFSPALQLIGSTPNLVKLRATGDNISHFLHYLTHRSQDSSSSSTTTSLTDLEISIPNESVFRDMFDVQLQGKFGGCKSLKIIQEEATSIMVGFGSFLSRTFPNLEALELHYNKACGLYLRDGGPELPEVGLESVAPRLTSVGFYANNSYSTDLEDLRFNGKQLLYSLIASSSYFPNISSISFDFMAWHYLSFGNRMLKHSEATGPSLPPEINVALQPLTSVKEFKITIPNDINMSCTDETSRHVRHVLDRLFPNLDQLWLNVKELKEGAEEEAEEAAAYKTFQFKAVLFFLKYFCSKVQGLRIDNYYGDWLKELYKEEPNGFPELKSLKLTRSLKSSVKSTTKGFTTDKKTGLGLLLDNTLGLERLEIDCQLYRYGVCANKHESSTDALDRTRIKNSTFRIDLI